MFGHPPFLGEVRLAQASYPYPVSYPDAYARYNDLRQKYVDAIESGDEEMARYYEYEGEELREAYHIPLEFKEILPLPTRRPTNYTTKVRQGTDFGGVLFPPLPPSPPPPPPVQTPRSPMRTGNIPEGAYLPTPTPGTTQQAQGLPCPEGQYRPPGGAWCVPKPVATAYRGIPTVPYGSLFSGGFFGGSQGVSAASFT